MKNVEDAATKLKWNKWPCRTIAYIDYKLILTYVNRLKIQAGPSVILYSTIIRVEWLLYCNLVPIHP